MCKRDSALRMVLDRWEACSGKFLLLFVKRTQTPTVASRLADVLREALGEFAKFHVDHPSLVLIVCKVGDLMAAITE